MARKPLSGNTRTGPALPGREPRPGGIQSLERAFAILERVAATPGGIGLSDLGRATGLHTSTAFHLIKTMQQLDYVLQDEETRRYRLGPRALRLVGSSAELTDLVARVEPFVERLAALTGDSAHYAVLTGSDVQVIARADGSGAFRLNEAMAIGRPAHATAIGKVLLAHLSEAALDRFLAATRLDAYTGRTITSRTRLKAELATVRAEGLAFDDTEFHEDLRCVAVPVRDHRRRVVGALGISAPAFRVSLGALGDKAPIVRSAATEVSRALGHPDADRG